LECSVLQLYLDRFEGHPIFIDKYTKEQDTLKVDLLLVMIIMHPILIEIPTIEEETFRKDLLLIISSIFFLFSIISI
jgi:hypothetical protein